MSSSKCVTLRNLRIESCLTINALAQETGLKPGWIYAFEQGKSVPWPLARKCLAKFFGVPESRLFPEIVMIFGASSETLYPPCRELRQARMAAKLTQTRLGLMVGLNGAYISRFENGAVEPWVSAIAAISVTLKMDPVDLFPFLSQKPRKLNRVVEKIDKVKDPVLALQEAINLLSLATRRPSPKGKPIPPNRSE
jgi:transcriptional regulator with XRE-family HTH domain